MNNTTPQLSDQWSSKWAFILAATGAAVGLGNIWRFPYLVGTQGGSAFLFLYLACLVLLGLPILIAEILIGRHSRMNAVDAMRHLATRYHHSARWQWVSWLGAVALIMILSFYSVVSGWSIAYLWHTLTHGFSAQSTTAIQAHWQALIASPGQLLTWHSLFMLLTIGVIWLGVEQGLERATKLMMPGLYLILFVLVGMAAYLGDFHQAWRYLFHFNPAAITTSTVIMALGQAFFTLALGAGAMLTYGAYAPQQTSLPFAVSIIAVLDVLVAVLAGLAIFPLVFAFHLPTDSGPNLMYITLPIAFSHIPFGTAIAAAFFILLLFAAWTSSINLAEPVVIILMTKCRLSRGMAACCTGLCAWLLGIASLLSFNVWQHVTIQGKTFFDLVTTIPTNVILPIGGLGYALFAGWVLPASATRTEIPSRLHNAWRFLIRYIAPPAIVIIFIFNWL